MKKKYKNAARGPGLFALSTREVLLILAGGFGLFLGFPNPIIQVPPLALLAPFCVSLLALEAASRRKAALNAFLCMLLGNSLGLYWISFPMTDYGGVPWAPAVLLVMLLGAVLAMFAAVYALAARLFSHTLPAALFLPGAALAWGALELLRGWMFSGFPWLSLSSAFMGWPVLAQAASVFGMYGLSAVYAFITLMFLPLALKAPPAARPAGLTPSGKKICLGIGLLCCAAIVCHGWLRMNRDYGGNIQAVLVMAQGNIEQAQKWDLDKQSATVEHYLALSRQGMDLAREQGLEPDMVIWPETSAPFFFEASRELGAPIREFARQNRIAVTFGAPGRAARLSESGTFNRVWLLGDKGQDLAYYDKEHLVPFGEYLPLNIYVPFAVEFLQGWGFTPGRDQQPLRYGNIAAGMLICYEAIFPELAQSRVEKGANLLINVSNDAWFGKSAAPEQHLQQAAMRAVEQGRYLARSTNTGISCFVDPAGRVRDPSAIFTAHAQYGTVRLLSQTTFYHDFYRAITIILGLAPALLLAWSVTAENMRKKNNAATR